MVGFSAAAAVLLSLCASGPGLELVAHAQRKVAKDYETGPAWVYAPGDGSKAFGEVEYCLDSGYPAATLELRNVKSSDVAAYKLPNGYAALVVAGTKEVLAVRLYAERGEDCAVGVYRVKFADGKTWATRQRNDATPYRGEGFDHLDEIKNLTTLNLGGMQLAAADWQRLKQLPNLRGLNLSETNVRDEDLKHLAEVPQLYRVCLSKTQVTEAGVKELRKAMPRVRISR